MKSTDLLREEHIYIKMVLGAARKQCIRIVNGEKVEFQLFYDIIDFVKNYADKHHHKKEEDHLFNIMSTELGDVIKNGPIMGMLVEHDFGRAHMYELEKALKECENGNQDARVDIIAHAIGYEQMLLKHIDKEDNAIYTFAEKSLSQDTWQKLEKDFEHIESWAESEQVRNKYVAFAKRVSEL